MHSQRHTDRHMEVPQALTLTLQPAWAWANSPGLAKPTTHHEPHTMPYTQAVHKCQERKHNGQNAPQHLRHTRTPGFFYGSKFAAFQDLNRGIGWHEGPRTAVCCCRPVCRMLWDVHS
jgi:hypothetical protein